MIRRHYIKIIFAILLPITACNLDQLEEDQLPSFNKLYVLSENVEAIDFICKPDASGYIIVGNLKSDENSDIIIIDVGADGLQRNLHRITSSTFDEAVSVKFYEEDNSILILGHRKSDPSQVNVEQNILIKSNLEGIPFQANNTDSEDLVSAEVKILTNNTITPIQLNDFLISPPNLIAVGTIRQSLNGNFNKITQIFDIGSVDFTSKTDSVVRVRQKPDVITYNNSRSLKIIKGSLPSTTYEVIGQNFSENPDSIISGPSQNIAWHVFSDLESVAGEPIFIGTDENEVFGDILFHSNGKNYIAGNYENTETVFLISKDYTGFNNNRGQTIEPFTEFGNKVSSLTEDVDGNIIMATIEEGDINNTSYLLKFSQAGLPIEDQKFVFESTGLYNIKKIESEPGNILVILSQKTFENNSTAIGLMKIKF